MTATFEAHAPGISCDGCANAIKRSLGALPGIQTVEVDVPAKNVTVLFDSARLTGQEIRAKLDAAGFPME